MELLYVWIKKYKNIEEQGFNFSPKWRFHYDPKTGKLEVDDRRDKVIGNFFGEHISNVTAIVGENGSGKSSLVDILQKPLSQSTLFMYGFQKESELFLVALKHKLLSLESLRDKNVCLLDENIIDGSGSGIYLEYFDGYQFNYIEVANIYFASNFQIRHSRIREGTTFSLSDYDLLENSINLKDNFKVKLYSELNKINTRNQISFIEKFRKLLPFEHVPNFLLIGIKNFHGIPRYASIRRFKDKFIDIAHGDTMDERMTKSVVSKLIDWSLFFEFSNCFALFEAHVAETHLERILESLKDKVESSMALDLIVEAVSELAGFEIEAEKVKSKILKLKNDYFELMDFYGVEFVEFPDESIKVPVDVLEKGVFKSFYSSFSNSQFTRFNRGIFEFQWIRKPFEREENYYEGDNYLLSSGEEKFINFFSRLYSGIKDVQSRNILFLIDEGSTSFHPEWQKRYVSYLMNLLPEIFPDKSLQIILTSHSPFVLSDLPKENVIFLKKGEDGKCQVADGLNEMKQTFGANIHTLLSDSFFMDGLMGDFAKGKIDEVIQYLNGEKVEDMDDEKADKIINMIGEPILKRHLQQQLDFKKKKKADDNEKKIERLESELKKLKIAVYKSKKKKSE